ncbi:disease resistance protein RPP13-like [Arachis ipaensis]|uniref:disease resistance protein RPP13-like n=1 Tax=Arachis ipaensis TaxID=130454 RepID=UPI0007AF80BF|nr:disease resistance protein RPP13-like [Arachis ipaensis]XP_020977861.1 disease resistance protein RPP13-like [Arachis ipaensis]XP_020977862.1 disease resistance protein RPP13-like [Arachis ipaensis]XP_020977863.1 disease resistance protein RPP13-like [Arachis ipaensis]XP_025650302.1 disease resistance protein RPP13-like [Arachis hypogaea]XP_025650303.1 disease resistance protein RPP13-like [Arachis hypogaea]XP_025697028.1 disease resistance protein RPP13-like [Arachis hypogaea]XP_02569702
MADGVVSFLIQNLSQLLVDEAKLLSGVEGKVKSLISELKFIDIFLKSSEGKRNNNIVKEVVNQIRDVAYEAEDVVDNYVANVSLHRSRSILGKMFHCVGQAMMLHNVDAEIENIKRSISEIYSNRDKYGIGEGEFQCGGEATPAATEALRKRRRDVEEEDVVGLVHESDTVIKKLLKTDSRLQIASIIGMGGLGKTTLARKIYNSKKVKEKYPFRAWGYVSNEYRAKELLLSLIRCLSTWKSNEESEEELKEHLRECLNGKKYLIVLDDIWKTEVWDDVKGAFPDDNNGSRILITSRIGEVAAYMGTMPPYFLPFLTEEQSWELFSKKVFRGEEDCPPDLKDLGMSIVESCSGLPLAIVVLAGHVSKKEKSLREWSRIKEHWLRVRDNNTVVVMDILKLSYDSLPQKLKSCFLYFAIYPEDYEIPARNLIQLWVAEGFIQIPETGTSDTLALEDIAEYYLEELVDRSLVQVASKRSDGGVKTCRIHDLLRDLCVSESKASKFIEIHRELDINKSNSRKMSFHHSTQFSSSPNKNNHFHTHSLFLFGEELTWDDESKGCKQFRKSFKLARVLHLNKVLLDLPPSGLKLMIHLRYLKIKTDSRSAENILDSISNLRNLETLHLSCDWVVSIPIKIWKLKRLRHFNLRIKEISQMSRVTNNERMSNLQTLCEVPLYSETISMLNNNGSFPNLKKLGLCFYPNFQQSSTGAANLSSLSMNHLSKLCTLKIRGDLFNPFSANGFKSTFFPSNIEKITLVDFKELDFKALGKLRNLRILKLRRGSTGDGIHCVAGEFPALQMLQMKEVKVERWIQDEGAMPSLSRLIIKGGAVEDLPLQLQSLASIK